MTTSDTRLGRAKKKSKMSKSLTGWADERWINEMGADFKFNEINLPTIFKRESYLAYPKKINITIKEL